MLGPSTRRDLDEEAGRAKESIQEYCLTGRGLLHAALGCIMLRGASHKMQRTDGSDAA